MYMYRERENAVLFVYNTYIEDEGLQLGRAQARAAELPLEHPALRRRLPLLRLRGSGGPGERGQPEARGGRAGGVGRLRTRCVFQNLLQHKQL